MFEQSPKNNEAISFNEFISLFQDKFYEEIINTVI